MTQINTIKRESEMKLLARQNDNFRKSPIISEDMGMVVYTEAVLAEGCGFVLETLQAVKSYDNFDKDIDPYETHEMGKVTVQGKTIWFKIDLYDESYRFGSEVPTDLTQTRRVMTILFPSDY